jgi:hypothetical protein
MSVRATERLIADIVTVTELPNSPRMVVVSVDIDKKTVSTAWFSDTNTAEQGIFPASALDRVDLTVVVPAKRGPKAATPAAQKPGRR